jgi:predicted esterase
MNRHLSQPVVREGPAVSAGRGATVLVHGRNQTPDHVLSIARRIELPGMPYVAITAAELSWYPKGFMAPLEENQPSLDHALARLEAMVRDLEAIGVPRRRVALLGFSQGACLISEYAYRHAERWGALVILTGGLLGPDGTTWPASRGFAGTPVFLSGSDLDPWVPARRVRETRDVFARMAADVDHLEYPGADHLVSDEEVHRARAVLAPLV